MTKYIIVLAIFIGGLFSCATIPIVTPEGTSLEVAEVMTKFYLQKPKAEKVISAFENQSRLANHKVSDIASAYKTTMGNHRVLVVRNDIYVKID